MARMSSRNIKIVDCFECQMVVYPVSCVVHRGGTLIVIQELDSGEGRVLSHQQRTHRSVDGVV